jgi:hypothetical protein
MAAELSHRLPKRRFQCNEDVDTGRPEGAGPRERNRRHRCSGNMSSSFSIPCFSSRPNFGASSHPFSPFLVPEIARLVADNRRDPDVSEQ